MNTPVTEQPYIKGLEEKMVQSKKGVIVFGALIFGSCLLAGCAHFFFHYRYMPLIQLSSILLLGCFYCASMQKKLTGKETFSHALFLAVALFVSLSGFYFLKNSFQFIDILSLAAAFLLPNMIMEAWRLFHSISSRDKPVWSYSEEIPPEPLFVYLENKPLHVKLYIGDNHPLMISSVAPRTLPVGQAIFYILKKEVEANSVDWHPLFIDENGNPYKWLFYTQTYGFVKTYLNPEETLFENNIRSHALIIAKRIEE